ncbi:23S rRNA methyltransferase [Lysinibacillus sp. 2017]|uniref:23S rRNA methyltransferase n=1 Tax=unclassified Lysinibacillus TaxID=2636778 RepID=UPI000D5291A0|nr:MULTISPECIES: 23S rRNA methyltransferase [unclassified Lysinibacillus]AWE08069.1 23S rRNA methyltransferase [Lysinibacillus sp. 2017]TGN36426.1 23S rRNA methyltransferase [Lysinibacillus sp. S2017]
MKKLIPLLLFASILTGCGDTYSEIKEAVSGIGSKANDAAAAISVEVHTLRAVELQYNNETFTINDLFKTTLRDVQWLYDEKKQYLKITGTWKDNELFADQQYNDTKKAQLRENGDVEVHLFFDNETLIEEKTTVTMQLQSETLIDETGTDALDHFYKVYAAQ